MESETVLLLTHFSNIKWASSNGYIMLTSRLVPLSPHTKHTTRTHTHTTQQITFEITISNYTTQRITWKILPNKNVESHKNHDNAEYFSDKIIHNVIRRDGTTVRTMTIQGNLRTAWKGEFAI